MEKIKNSFWFRHFLMCSVLANKMMSHRGWYVDNFAQSIIESERQNFYTLTDTENQIVCLFEKGKFNETQKFSFLKDGNFNAANLATIMREFGDWLQVNHSSIV